jgi:cell division protein FtsB
MNRIQTSQGYLNLPEIFRTLPPADKRFFLVVCLISFLVSVSWLLFSPNGVLNYYNIEKKLQLVQVENRKLKAENEQLKVEIKKLNQDPTYLEKVARKDFGLIKKNEMVFSFD